MSKTLLDGVNDVLVKMKKIEGDSSALTSLSNSPLQTYIDTAVMAWNEAIDELYSVDGVAKPKEQGLTTVTLVASDRDYTLPTDLIQIQWPLINEATGDEIFEYSGGYEQLRRDQVQPANFTGKPQAGVVHPRTAELYLDRLPTATEAGSVYQLVYDKDLSMSNATDVFPFADVVYRAMVAVVTELVRRDMQTTYDEGVAKKSFGRASKLLTMTKPRDSYLPLRGGVNITDPYNA